MLLRSLAVAALAASLSAGSAAAAETGARAPGVPVCTGGCYVAPPRSGALFVISGHGWGHGVGMSQYGAYGYAQHGWTAPQILAHYYPGTTLGTTTAATVRVLLADRQPALKLSSGAAFSVEDGNGRTHTLAAGSVALAPALKLRVDGAKAPQALPPPLTFAPGSGNLTLGLPYRGQIEVDVVDGKLRAINVVPLEQYLYGVVPAEMPSGWAPEALKAQAVAARSYALATRKVAAPFDVYPDTRSQVYRGLSQERAAATAAVDATRGQVLTFAGKVATTYFFSTSGGRTESSLDWSGVQVPYLVSVPDPYDALSPYHDWGPLPLTGKQVAGALGLPGPALDLRPTADAAGRVRALDVVAQAKGTQATATVSGPKVRAALGLRSTWFTVGVLSLTPPSPGPPATYGTPVKLAGIARGLGGAALEERSFGSSWRSAGAVTPSASGSVQLTERPAITTDYRLATPAAAAAAVRVRIAPRVRVTAVAAGQVLGTERPVLPGALVRIERRSGGGTWSVVGHGAAGAAGSFAIPVPLVSAAAYRAVVTPRHGYSPGVSAPLTAVG